MLLTAIRLEDCHGLLFFASLAAKWHVSITVRPSGKQPFP